MTLNQLPAQVPGGLSGKPSPPQWGFEEGKGRSWQSGRAIIDSKQRGGCQERADEADIATWGPIGESRAGGGKSAGPSACGDLDVLFRK